MMLKPPKPEPARMAPKPFSLDDYELIAPKPKGQRASSSDTCPHMLNPAVIRRILNDKLSYRVYLRRGVSLTALLRDYDVLVAIANPRKGSRRSLTRFAGLLAECVEVASGGRLSTYAEPLPFKYQCLRGQTLMRIRPTRPWIS